MSELLKIARDNNLCLGIAAAGCGTTTINDLYSNPGTSWAVSFADFISKQGPLIDSLGYDEKKAVTKEAAIGLATQAFVKLSKHLSLEEVSEEFGASVPVAIGITGAIATERILRGGNRVHICVITPNECLYKFLELPSAKDKSARIYHDALIHNEIVNIVDCLSWEAELAEQKIFDCSEDVRKLLLLRPLFFQNKRLEATKFGDYICGSFNPPHEGHVSMSKASERPTFSINLDPPKDHKDPMTVQDVLSRIGQIQGLFVGKDEDPRIEITQEEGLFLDKIKTRPQSRFFVGADTLDRILNPSWGIDHKALLTALRENRSQIKVMQRLQDDKLMTLNSVLETWGLLNDTAIRDNIQEIPGRVDISSTELRK